MSIEINGIGGGAGIKSDPTMGALRVSTRPPEILSWASYGLQTGLLTGVAAGASVFSLRNTGTNKVLLRRVGIGFILTTAFSTAQLMEFGVMIARSWTAADSGGTTLTLSGVSSGKHATALPAFTSLDAKIGGTGSLTAGTRTLDGVFNAQTGGYAGAIGNVITPAPNNLVQQDTGDYPIVLANNEGIIIAPVIAMGSTGAGKLYINLEMAEATAYP